MLINVWPQEDSKKIQGPGGGGPNLPEKRRPEPWTRKSTSTDQDVRSITTIITMLKDMNRHKSKWHNMRQYNTMLWDAKLSNILGFWVPRKRMYTNVNSQMKYSNSTQQSGWFNLFVSVGRHPLDSCLRWLSCEGCAGRPAVSGGALMRSTVLKASPRELRQLRSVKAILDKDTRIQCVGS